MKHPALTRLIIVLILFALTSVEVLAADYYHAKVTAEVVPTGTSVYGGTVMVQKYGSDQGEYSTSSTGGNYTVNLMWDPSTGGNPVNVTMKAKSGDGYNFEGWYNKNESSILQFISSENTYTGSFNTGTNKGEENAELYTIYAKFSPIPYTITYNAGNHSSGGSTTATSYDIENGFSLASNGFAPAAGWVFDKWKVTAAGSGSDGNWTLNNTYEAGASITAGKFGNVTMTAQWKENPYADITITVSGLQGDDSAIFTVSSGGSVLYTVSVSASNPSVTIKNLPIGVTYDVNPKHQWNWNYSGTNVTESFSLGASGHTASFTYTKNTSAKKHDEKSNVNWRP